jgi:dipeptidase E
MRAKGERMSGQIVAMGAGRALMERPRDPLHRYVLDLCETQEPRVMFLPTASGDDPGYIVAFYDTYTQLPCRPSHLKLFYREELDLRSYILSHDVIHVGGGNTANMLDVWRRHGVDRILLEAWKAGKVLCGGSAGAICWFEGGVTDSFGTRRLAALNDGLALLSGSLCPHYDVDALRAPAYQGMLRAGELPPGYAADDHVGLHFDGRDFKTAITSRADGKAYRVSASGESITQDELPITKI